MTYISIVHDAKNHKKHITVDKDGDIHHYVVNDNILDALITHTLFPGSQIRPVLPEMEREQKIRINTDMNGESRTAELKREINGKGKTQNPKKRSKGKDGNHS